MPDVAEEAERVIEAVVNRPGVSLMVPEVRALVTLARSLVGRVVDAERVGREKVYDDLVEDAERVYPKGTDVFVFDANGYGVRPNGVRVGDGSLWVRGRVEFVCGRKSGGHAGHVSVYCDDGRGRRVVGPHDIVLASALAASALSTAQARARELEAATWRREDPKAYFALEDQTARWQRIAAERDQRLVEANVGNERLAARVRELEKVRDAAERIESPLVANGSREWHQAWADLRAALAATEAR